MSHTEARADFYRSNAASYCAATIKVDMRQARDRFVSRVPAGGHILDAGCGSGRDMLVFATKGFVVRGIDGSPEMAAHASLYSGQPCDVLRFQDIQFEGLFDGVWSCAALLHVPKREMGDVIRRLAISLKSEGILYASFIEGDGERIASDGRLYNSYTPQTFRRLIAETGILEEVELWSSDNLGSQEKPAPWLNVIVKKT